MKKKQIVTLVIVIVLIILATTYAYFLAKSNQTLTGHELIEISN